MRYLPLSFSGDIDRSLVYAPRYFFEGCSSDRLVQDFLYSLVLQSWGKPMQCGSCRFPAQLLNTEETKRFLDLPRLAVKGWGADNVPAVRVFISLNLESGRGRSANGTQVSLYSQVCHSGRSRSPRLDDKRVLWEQAGSGEVGIVQIDRAGE